MRQLKILRKSPALPPELIEEVREQYEACSILPVTKRMFGNSVVWAESDDPNVAWFAVAATKAARLEIYAHKDYLDAQATPLFSDPSEEETKDFILDAFYNPAIQKQRGAREDYLSRYWEFAVPRKEADRERLYSSLLFVKALEGTRIKSYRRLLEANKQALEALKTNGVTESFRNLFKYNTLVYSARHIPQTRLLQKKIDRRIKANLRLAKIKDAEPTKTVLVLPSGPSSSWLKTVLSENEARAFCESKVFGGPIIVVDNKAGREIYRDRVSKILIHEMIHSIQPGVSGYLHDLDRCLTEGATELLAQRRFERKKKDFNKSYRQEVAVVETLVSAIAERENRESNEILEELNLATRERRIDILMAFFAGENIQKKSEELQTVMDQSYNRSKEKAKQAGVLWYEWSSRGDTLTAATQKETRAYLSGPGKQSRLF